MIELQDLVDGHHAEIDLRLADRRVHPLARRREDANLSEHGARAELDRDVDQSERAADHDVEFRRRIAACRAVRCSGR